MEDCQSQEDRDVFRWKPFLRQVFVCSAIWCTDFLLGLSYGAPAVLIPQVRQEMNSTSAVSEEMESWLSSGFPIMIVWIFILPFMAEKYGRRLTFLFVALNSVVGFTGFYCSRNLTQVFISNLMLGAAEGAMVGINPMIVAEYTSPQNRGFMLSVKIACLYWGIWVANAIGIFSHWKHIGIIGILSAVYCMTAVFWPDSPYWLASKGRYKECAAAHQWLQGSPDIGSKAELETLIHSQKEMLSNPTTGVNMENRENLANFLRKTTTEEYYKPILFSVLILMLSCFSGKLVMSVYALSIIKKMTHSTSAANSGILILDGLTIFSAYIGCALTRVLKRRTLYLVASSISICFTLVISLHLYLINFNLLSENSILSILLLSCYSISTSCGPMVLTGTLMFELIPSKFKTFMVISVALIANIVSFILLKTSPMTFRVLGIHNTFLLYGIPSLILLYVFYKYFPETKDKSVYEIERMMKKKDEVL